MKKILGIIGSPRRLGNCEIMVKEIARQISISNELKLLRLSDFSILPCRGCYRCLFNEEDCSLKDDFNMVLHAIIQADALILSVPTYFLGPNSCVKRLIDRGLSFNAHVDKLWGKPAVGVGIAGIDGKDGYTLLGITSFLKLILSEVKASKIVYGALPGEVFLNQQNKKTAAELASVLFRPKPEIKQHGCPLCGGDTFRFIEKDKVQCMLCSNSGAITIKGENPLFKINKSEHELFLSKEGVLKHRDWLKDMKSRYIAQKEQLREITRPYQKEGIWIKPQ